MTDWTAQFDAWWSGKTSNLFTALPGTIQAYDGHAKRTARVSIDVQIPGFVDFIEIKEDLSEVPVMFPCTSTYSNLYPLKQGDGCLIIVSTASLKQWYISDVAEKKPKPATLRKYSLGGAICIPGLFKKNLLPEIVGNEDDLVIHYGDGVFSITPEGKFSIKGQTEELVSIMSEYIELMKNAMTVTSIGPQPFTPPFIAQLDALKTRLDTLKV